MKKSVSTREETKQHSIKGKFGLHTSHAPSKPKKPTPIVKAKSKK